MHSAWRNSNPPAGRRATDRSDSSRVPAGLGILGGMRKIASSASRSVAILASPVELGGVADVRLIHYLSNLSKGRLILWCYFIWYLVVLVRYFDPSPRLWLTSLGLSLIIGFALYVSTTAAGDKKVDLERWQVIRLFMMPFCVSSFSALVKGRGFFLIFSPNLAETMLAVGLCAVLCGTVALLKRRRSSVANQAPRRIQ